MPCGWRQTFCHKIWAGWPHYSRNKFEQDAVRGYQSPVQLLKKLFALALVAIWSLAVNHCNLEQLTGFQFLKCSELASAATHPVDDCQTDGCANVESGSYKTEDGQAAVHLVAAAQIPAAGIFLEPVRPAAGNHLVFQSAPLEISQGWQFVFRTAAPPRAPSFAS